MGVAQCVHRRPVDAAVVGERGCVCRWCAEGRYSISVCCDEDDAEEWRRSQLRGLCCAVQRLTDREGSGRSGRSGQVRSGQARFSKSGWTGGRGGEGIRREGCGGESASRNTCLLLRAFCGESGAEGRCTMAEAGTNVNRAAVGENKGLLVGEVVLCCTNVNGACPAVRACVRAGVKSEGIEGVQVMRDARESDGSRLIPRVDESGD